MNNPSKMAKIKMIIDSLDFDKDQMKNELDSNTLSKIIENKWK